MDDKYTDDQESLTPEEDDTSKNEEAEEVDDEQTDEELEKAKELAQNQKIRAEKAERELKKLKANKEPEQSEDEPTPKKESVISPEDSARLIQANVPVDDWGDVIDYANFKKLSIKEAMGSSVVKATLGEKEEERKTAGAANTGKAKRGSSKTSGADAYAKALKDGTIPDDDAALDAMLTERYKPAT